MIFFTQDGRGAGIEAIGVGQTSISLLGNAVLKEEFPSVRLTNVLTTRKGTEFYFTKTTAGGAMRIDRYGRSSWCVSLGSIPKQLVLPAPFGSTPVTSITKTRAGFMALVGPYRKPLAWRKLKVDRPVAEPVIPEPDLFIGHEAIAEAVARDRLDNALEAEYGTPPPTATPDKLPADEAVARFREAFPGVAAHWQGRMSAPQERPKLPGVIPVNDELAYLVHRFNDIFHRNYGAISLKVVDEELQVWIKAGTNLI